MNETVETIGPVAQEITSNSGGEIIILLLLAVCVWVLGISMGVALSRPPNATRRVMLKALENYRGQTEDTIILGIVNRQIRRLQNSLGIDDDEP